MFMNLDINLNAPRFDLLASRQLAFLTLGFTQSQHFDAAYKVTTLHFGYGLDSLLECLVFPASYLAQVYDDHDDHDGVFEYDVSETAGDLLATLLATRNGQLDWWDFIKAIQPALNRFFKIQPPTPTQVPADLYLRVLNYLETCCETERHNPEDPCHRLLPEMDALGETDPETEKFN